MKESLYTVIDACINRAIEGLRVCEDIFRFVLHNPVSAEFKVLRHSVRDAVSGIPVSCLLEARDIVSDSQKFIDTAGESMRAGLQDVFRANIRRAAEAARSLEELFKIEDPAAGARFQSIRFSIYEVEKICWFILHRADLSERVKNSSAAVVPADLSSRDFPAACKQAVDHGAGIIIFRPGTASDRINLAAAEIISSYCRDHYILYFIFSRPDLALLSAAQGLCLERSDISAVEARRITGSSILIGVSAGDRCGAEDDAPCDVDFVILKENENSFKLKIIKTVND